MLCDDHLNTRVLSDGQLTPLLGYQCPRNMVITHPVPLYQYGISLFTFVSIGVGISYVLVLATFQGVLFYEATVATALVDPVFTVIWLARKKQTDLKQRKRFSCLAASGPEPSCIFGRKSMEETFRGTSTRHN